MAGRFARAGLALLALPLLATPVAAPPPPGPGDAATARIFAEPVALNPDRPGDRRLGPLLYVGGWVLTSDDRRFGSISAMQVADGRVTALGDRGILFRFPLPDAAPGQLWITPLPAGPGGFASSVERDSESLAVAGDAAWVGFENSNEVWRYNLPGLQPTARAAPAPMAEWAANRGAETLSILPGGRFLAISEDTHDTERISDALLFDGDPALPGTAATPLRISLPAGHRITDAAWLGERRVLLLSRGFTARQGWSAKLLVADLPAEGAEVRPREIAALAAPLTIDNMEALSVTQEQGRTIVWIASDDNLWPLQRTLLMKFEWIG